MNEIIKEILGENLNLITLATCYIFAGFGAFLHWFYETKKGIKNSKRSPNRFSFKYWFENNLLLKVQSLIASVIIIFLSLRFTEFSITAGMALYPSAVIAGASIDLLITNFNNKK